MKEKLIKAAKKARTRAYVPYSNFAVGAAVLTESGQVYTGCNIENAAYPVTCCAERVAIFNALANGDSAFVEFAVVADTERPVPPCGSCRQVMSEFFDPNMKIHLTNRNEQTKTVTLEALLPFSFNADDMD
ncbi:cytidine deaminase [Virgibacillus sp. W0430]|uniref:cytidine deaminase n=1 Tax=Virgibacillus sp. W0430 TaxID=3391580 RepID=UPI003F46F099